MRFFSPFKKKNKIDKYTEVLEQNRSTPIQTLHYFSKTILCYPHTIIQK